MYLEIEMRPLYRSTIPTTQSMRRSLVSNFKKKYQGVGYSIDHRYSFFSSNCAGAILNLFSESGIPVLNLTSPIPSLLPNELNRQGIAPYPSIALTGLGDALESLSKFSNTPKDDLKEG